MFIALNGTKYVIFLPIAGQKRDGFRPILKSEVNANIPSWDLISFCKLYFANSIFYIKNSYTIHTHIFAGYYISNIPRVFYKECNPEDKKQEFMDT